MDTNEPNVPQTGGNKNILTLVTGLGLLAIIGFFILKSGNDPNQQNRAGQNGNMESPQAQDEKKGPSEKKMPANIKEFTVKANNFKYDIAEIKVKKGDTVRINFINDEGFHDWKLDEFNAATAKLNAGGKETIEFYADKTGTFEYYCSVGKHREMGMVGNLVVE